MPLVLLDPSAHPTDDPQFPSYENPSYQASKDLLIFLADMQSGSKNWLSPTGKVLNKEKLEAYLPKFPKEKINNYKTRYTLTKWLGFFEKPLREFPGYLADITYAPTTFVALKNAWSSGDGNNLSVPGVLAAADPLVLRDNAVFVMVDADKENNEKIVLDKDLETAKNLPFLRLIPRINVIDWGFNDGKLAYVCIVEGFQNSLQYRQIYPDGSYTVKTIYNDTDRKQLVIVETESPGNYSLGRLPLFVYSLNELDPLNNNYPLMNVANLQLEYYQLKSEDRIAAFKQGFSLLVRSGIQRDPKKTQAPEEGFDAGVSTGLDLPTEGSAYYISPATEWAAVYQSRLEKIEQLARDEGLAFSGVDTNSVNPTATGALIQATGAKSQLSQLRDRKISALDQIEVLFAAWYKRQITVAAGSESNFTITLPMEKMMQHLAKQQKATTESLGS